MRSSGLGSPPALRRSVLAGSTRVNPRPARSARIERRARGADGEREPKDATEDRERCPLCGDSGGVRPKLLLIDQAWIPGSVNDSRLAFFADLRLDDVKPEHYRIEEP